MKQCDFDAESDYDGDCDIAMLDLASFDKLDNQKHQNQRVISEFVCSELNNDHFDLTEDFDVRNHH